MEVDKQIMKKNKEQRQVETQTAKNKDLSIF